MKMFYNLGARTEKIISSSELESCLICLYLIINEDNTFHAQVS